MPINSYWLGWQTSYKSQTVETVETYTKLDQMAVFRLTFGPTSISPAVTRFRSPPETPLCRLSPTIVSTQFSSPSSLMMTSVLTPVPQILQNPAQQLEKGVVYTCVTKSLPQLQQSTTTANRI